MARNRRSVLKTAEGAGPAAQTEIRTDVRGSPQDFCDETGWRIGGHKAWLHVAVGERESWYEVARTRDHDRLSRHLSAHLGEWVLFLFDPTVEATSNMAEHTRRLRGLQCTARVSPAARHASLLGCLPKGGGIVPSSNAAYPGTRRDGTRGIVLV